MTKAETKKNNVRIAGFMGYSFLTENVYQMIGGPIEGDEIYLGDLVSTEPLDTYEHYGQVFLRNSRQDYHYLGQYHKDWNDAISAVKEIRAREPKEYKPTHFCLEYPAYLNAIKEALEFIDLELLNKEILEFVNWYNKYKDEK